MAGQNEFSDAFSTAFDAGLSSLVDLCYPDGADWLCAYDQDELGTMLADERTALVMARAEALAWSVLSSLLGYRLSLCPVVVRPCARGCSPQTWDQAVAQGTDYTGVPSGGVFSPYISAGSWFNGCGCWSRESCSCTTICQVILPTPVGGIESVWLNGEALPSSAYRVDNGDRLVRQDGECWPSCQDMNLPPDDENAFTITYYPFLAPNDLLRYAAGVLAVEFFKACSGGPCRLPQGVTNITRSGISMEIPSSLFANGATGLREVDPIIRIYNPNALKSPARVLSPDTRRGRIQTWGA